MITGRAQASAWKTLFGITRAAFSPVPKIPRAHAAPRYASGRSSYGIHGTCVDVRRPRLQQGVLLPASDDAQLELGRERRGLEDRLEPVQRDELADEEGVERLGRVPAGAEERLVGPDERDRDALLGQPEGLAEERRVRLRVGDHEVGRPERGMVDRAHDARARASDGGTARGR